MKKIIAWLLVLSLTAAISIGATLAYLTDTDEDVNVMTLGKVKIDQLEYERVDVESKDDNATVQEFHDNKPLLPAVTDKDFTYTPGDTYVDWDQIGKDGYTSKIWDPAKINNEVDKMVFIKNKGDYDAFVRSVFAFEAGKYATLAEFQQMVHLNLNTTDYTWEWVQTPVAIPNEEGGTTNYFVATATYNKVLAPGALTEISLSQIALDKTATNEDVEAFGDTYQILVKSQGIQADGFENADTALTEGFGEITANVLPWTTDSAVQGTDLRTALHYLNGDQTGTGITNSVSKVVYALNSEYPEIVNKEKGTLVDVEQDVAVNAYYIKDGSTYTVYFLANDTIYSPKNSADLYANMGALVEVDTHNYDVSRVENMSNMFLNCKNLAVMDTSDWDTGNVTTMFQTFRNCNALVVEVGDWDVSKVTNMYTMFAYNYAMTELDVSKWQVGNVEDMGGMFGYCFDLTYLDVSQWDTGSVKSFKAMFQGKSNQGNMKISNLDVSNWDTSSCTIMNHMFYSCGQLTELDLSGWDVSNVVTMSHMFSDCFALQSVDFTGWNTSALTSMDGMFNDCRTIKQIDVSHFDTGNCVEFSQMFEACYALEKIIGLDQWDTSSGYVFDEMFNVCGALKELDLSSFDTSAATYGYILQNGEKNYHGYGNMFNGTSSLQKLILGEKFVFAGDGSIPAANYPKFPDPAAKEGYTAKWQNVDTKETYLAKDIPEGVAATYVPYYEYPANGATMKNALHYLNADPNGKQITANVTSVTYGLLADHGDIVNTYTGVLADQEQDGPVYAYYVPNGSNYDVYLLSDDVIYTPKDSTELFRNMTMLQKVDTTNLDVSRTEIMLRMFQSCSKLTEIDVSDWDTSSATTMARMFQSCTILPYLDVSDWDTGNVTDMYCLFGGSEYLNGLDVADWDVSKVTNMAYTFWHCYALENLDVANWDVGNVTTFEDMFAGKHNLGNMKVVPAVENWNMSSATSIRDMFYGCAQIETLDLSKWDVTDVKDMRHTFADCFGLKSINFSGWNTPNLENLDGTFNDCLVLTNLDMSNFNTSKVSTMTQLFEGCASLTTVKGMDKWDTTSLRDTSEMFSTNGRGSSLEVVDLSSFNTAALRNTGSMFSGCDKLTTVYVGDGWDLSNVTAHGGMFAGCTGLVGANGSTVADLKAVDKTYACVDAEGTPGYLTYKAPATTNP